MKPISIKALAKILGVKTENLQSVQVTEITTDSRDIKSGDCFFAIKGGNFDGHEYIKEALKSGAACAVTSRYIPGCEGRILKVEDTIESLGKLARWYREEMDFKVIAVTGSAGKTTTRQIIYQVLKQHFNCWQAPKSFNNNIGLPLTLLHANQEHKIVLVEIGSNRPGEISILTRIAVPDIAVVTNIFPAHLEGFGSVEAIIKEKISIREGLKDNGALVINGDFKELVDYCAISGYEFVTFGENEGCDIRAENLKSHGFTGELTIKGNEIAVGLAGKANLYNTLAAWAVCSQCGLSVEDFSRGVKELDAVNMRLEVEKTGSVTVINDCYNANPASMANALDCLENISVNTNSRKVFICGTMAELGTESQRLHAELGELIGKSEITLLLAAGDYARLIAERAKCCASPDFESQVFTNTEELCNNLQQFIQGDDIILVKGSRCTELEKVVKKLKNIFGNRN